MRYHQGSTTLVSRPDVKIRNLLTDPRTYNDHSECVEVVETHLSEVFLSRTRAIKLKKPVRFAFADLSTQQSRYQACQAELSVNRRWSEGVYLGVIPITMTSDGVCHLGGDGRKVDWVVKMRRLPAELQLTQQLRSEAAMPEDQVARLAKHLVGGFISLPSISMPADVFVDRIRSHEDDNSRELLRLAGSLEQHRILRIHNALLQCLWLIGDLFEERVRGGCVVDGHGDLRPEHVFMESPIQIIDGIEFSDEFRTNDQLDELCFFAMECEKAGADVLARSVLECYQRKSNLSLSETLVGFYKGYRAFVRAKVLALRAEQLSGPARRPFLRQMRGYLAFADWYAQHLGHPWMIALSGVMGSGKSTLAQAVSDISGAQVLSTDAIRRQMLGESPDRPAYGESNYDDNNRRKVYRQLIKQAADAMDWGRSVVLDGTFLTENQRRQAIRCALERQAPILFVRCQAPRHVLFCRLTERCVEGTSMSEARPDLLELQATSEESFGSGMTVADIDTTVPMDCQLDAVRQHLRSVCRAR